MYPKKHLDRLRLRNESYGKERRKDMTKVILEHGTPFPKPIEYSDIDDAMYRWVCDNIQIEYDGKTLPTYKLYSTQRLSEYMQTWDREDEAGNPIINFKTVTRELNPQKGTNQGDNFNIPGHRNYAVFFVPVLQENGTEAYDKYTMKQPFQVDFMYTVSIISNKMEVINRMNELMHYEFSSITCYISPNDHPMSMTLDSVSDESEYSIDDRKYYSQSYKVKVRGYIIRKEDYQVERIPSRLVMSMNESDAAGNVNRRGRNRKMEDRVSFMSSTVPDSKLIESSDDRCEPVPVTKKERPVESYEPADMEVECPVEEEERYYHKKVKIMVGFDECTSEVSFEMDKDVVIEEIDTENIKSLTIVINGNVVELDDAITLPNKANVTISIERDDLYKGSSLIMTGYDPNTVFDKEPSEVSMDEPVDEEHIFINYEEE